MCGLPEAVSVETLKVAWPLPFTGVAAPKMVVGVAQVPPSMSVTDPVVTGLAPDVTVAVKVTDWPKVEGLGVEPSAVDVLAWLTVWLTLPLLVAKLALPP